jgi:hypothetical protein
MLGAFGWRQLASVNRKIYSPTIIKTSVLHSSTSVRRQESLFFLPWLSSNEISFASGPLLGLRRLALVGAKVVDRESCSPKSRKQSVLC